MTRLIVLLLSIVILSESIGFNVLDIAKTGFLIEHAQYHSEKYGDSFWDFMSKHYGMNKANHDDETDEHNKLPFQQSNICTCIKDIEENTIELTTILTPPTVEKEKVSFYKNLYASIATNDIFQPPQAA